MLVELKIYIINKILFVADLKICSLTLTGKIKEVSCMGFGIHIFA